MKAGLVGRWARAAIACAAVLVGFNALAGTIPWNDGEKDGNVRMIVTADADGTLVGTFEHVGLLLMVK